MNFTHDNILINNRTVALPDILSGSAVSLSRFETETFSFIKKWLTGETEFNLTTSGSTGAPKEIILTRTQLQQSAFRTINALGLTNQHTALVCLDTKYIAGKMMLVRALEANMNIVAAEPSSNPFKNIPENSSIDFTALVPLQVEEILNDRATAKRLNTIQNIIIGGAALSNHLKSQISKLQSTVYATYGMTETVSHIALQKLTSADATEYFTTLNTVSITRDERDCLVITLPEFAEPIVTNDLVQIINSRTFQWLGRYDTIINSGGVKLSPEGIEQKLALAFKDALHSPSFFIAGVPDERLGQKLILVVEGTAHQEFKLLAIAKQYLTGYEVPKQIQFIPAFIRTETGKINRVKTVQLLSRYN
jgi:o-succinylbenzoate---CoA ligase